MRTAAAILAATLLLAGPGFAQTPAKPLWQNTTVGMSIDEVARAQPDAKPETKPDHLYNGALCSLKIQHFELIGSDYHVCFFFKKGRLSQVMLGSSNPSEADFNRIVDLLRAKYGKEISYEKSSGTISANWILSSGININILYTEIGTFRLLNINYQSDLLKEADKL